MGKFCEVCGKGTLNRSNAVSAQPQDPTPLGRLTFRRCAWL